ncbi:MAG: Crp/Fnr family transcriptional regulator [Saprospiraceae bacterium]|nr:Crp/Fnr family transcriptional regulator [Saprospiraceae bacterium]
MEDSNFWYLEKIDLTTILCPIKLGMEMDTHEYSSFKKGAYIYLQNDESKNIYFIASGQVKIGKMAEGGKEITKIILGKGEVFGEFAVLGEDGKKEYAQAMEDTKLCVTNSEDIKKLMREHTQLSLLFLKMFRSRLLKMEHRLESLVFKYSRSRILEFIVDEVNSHGSRVGYEWVVRNGLTHQEIANLTATSRQTVTTIMNELRNENVMTFNRKRWLIRDLDVLKQISNSQ